MSKQSALRRPTRHPTRGWPRAVLGATAALLLGTAAHGMSFSQAYEAARVHDANYRAAGHELEAASLNVPIARASLLPSVALTASDSKVQGWRRFPNGQNQEVNTRLNYDTPQANLTLRVPILNFDAVNGYRQAQAQTDVAEELFRAQGMDLMERLAAAYLQVLLANEARVLVQAQITTLETLLPQAQQRLQRGEGTRVQVSLYQASLDVARARLLESDGLLELARRQLARITGVPTTAVSALLGTGNPQPLFPERLGDWLEAAVRQSPTLRARERSVDVARLLVKRQYAGHLPRLDLVGSLSRSENDSTNNIGQSSNLRSIGVQLTVPIFSGGGVDASVRQALSRQSQAEEDLRGEREALEVDVQRHYQAVSTGTAKIAAYQQAVESASLAWQGTRRALELGLGTAGEAADAQGQYFLSLRDMTQSRIEQLLSRVRLLVRAGTPMPDVAADLDASLQAQTSAATSPVKP